ncbi:MAG: glucosamine-6-phosphate deaminase [Acidobacteriaceae bacterium]|nr:glucosamine-6-phosphate deaminase [Acidobacteriaceae bacterium]
MRPPRRLSSRQRSGLILQSRRRELSHKRKEERQETLTIEVHEDSRSLAEAAAKRAAALIQEAVAKRGKARIVAASAASQVEFLDSLTRIPGIDWVRVELFHLDEYIGLPMTHPASFCLFLQEHLISKTGIRNLHLLNGAADPGEVIRSTGEAIASEPIDVAFVGIGENGHLAFNDPPADFETEQPYLVVNLDEACRRQQVGEGWFKDLSEVPPTAISMSVKQVLKAREILAIVAGARKARAIAGCFNGPITPMAPSSILRTHPNATIYLDRDSAALLKPEVLATLATAG